MKTMGLGAPQVREQGGNPGVYRALDKVLKHHRVPLPGGVVAVTGKQADQGRLGA
jgi:hypothetical protein